MQWVQDSKTRKYTFAYDNLSRLKTAGYTGIGNEQYGTSYSYDKHGNMLTLQRYGKKGAGTNTVDYGLVDNLTAKYTGNQLKYISDAVDNFALNPSMDFKEYTEGTNTEYFYNLNGAMYKDLNRGISAITYNSLNLPQIVDIKNQSVEGRNEYTYSASGVKLKAVQRWNPNYNTAPVIGSDVNAGALTKSISTDYAGNIIYEDGTLKRILVDGGYYESGNYYFYITDHLGNNRIVADAAASVVQSTQYYPFGMPFADGMGQDVQPYKYNGKELDTRNGLNTHDYLTRALGSDFPVFRTPDGHAENYYPMSPYAYAGNNPINVIDPTGMDTTHVAYNSMDKQDYQIQANLPGGDGVIVADNDLPEVTVEADRIYPSPDYVGLSYTGTAILGVGISGSITIGIIPNDGLFTQFSLGFGAGLDISHSINYKQGTYKGEGKPTATSLEGYSRDINAGVYFVDGGYSQDMIENKDAKGYVVGNSYGEYWGIKSYGVSFGSKSVVGGSAVLSNTFGTNYLYKK